MEFHVPLICFSICAARLISRYNQSVVDTSTRQSDNNIADRLLESKCHNLTNMLVERSPIGRINADNICGYRGHKSSRLHVEPHNLSRLLPHRPLWRSSYTLPSLWPMHAQSSKHGSQCWGWRHKWCFRYQQHHWANWADMVTWSSSANGRYQGELAS